MGYFFANVRVSQLKIFLRSLLLLGSPLSIRRLLLLLYRRSGVIYLSSHERPLLIGSTLRRSLLLFSSSLLLLSSGVLLWRNIVWEQTVVSLVTPTLGKESARNPRHYIN
jgi:hypothetical protein